MVAKSDGAAKECDLLEAAGAAPDATVLVEDAGTGAGVAGTGAVAVGSPQCCSCSCQLPLCEASAGKQ